jgi:hypothetical protein
MWFFPKSSQKYRTESASNSETLVSGHFERREGTYVFLQFVTVFPFHERSSRKLPLPYWKRLRFWRSAVPDEGLSNAFRLSLLGCKRLPDCGIWCNLNPLISVWPNLFLQTIVNFCQFCQLSWKLSDDVPWPNDFLSLCIVSCPITQYLEKWIDLIRSELPEPRAVSFPWSFSKLNSDGFVERSPHLVATLLSLFSRCNSWLGESHKKFPSCRMI